MVSFNSLPLNVSLQGCFNSHLSFVENEPGLGLGFLAGVGSKVYQDDLYLYFKTGYFHGFERTELGFKRQSSNIPVALNIQYMLSKSTDNLRKSFYIETDIAINILRTSVEKFGAIGSKKISETLYGMAIGAGYRYQHVDLSLKLNALDVQDISNYVGLIFSVGYFFEGSN